MHSSLLTGKECRVAFIGAGGMAREHLRAFSDIPQVRVVGIFSRTRTKAECLAEEFHIPFVAASLDELYVGTAADLVVVTVNTDQLATMVTDCCRFPWSILAEKPIGLDEAESQAVLQLAEAKGQKIFVALNRRFYESTMVMLTDLEAVPDTRFIEVFDQQSPDLLRKLGKKPIEIDRLMFTNGIHVIDYLSMLGRGNVDSVVPILPWRTSSPCTVVVAAVYFSSGDTAVYRCIWNAPGPWAVNVTTAQKRWELRPLEKVAFQTKDSRTLQQVVLSDLDERFKPGLRRQAEEAVRAALGIESKSVPLSKAHETMRLIAQIYGC